MVTGPEDTLYEHLARIGKALASPGRLTLLALLGQAERTVERLVRAAGLAVANTSRHLQVLRSARLVEASREGSCVRYRLADAAVGRFWLALESLGRDRLAEIEQLMRDRFAGQPGVEPVTREDLCERLRKGETVLLDVRPAEEYRTAHIRGAVSVPLAELETRLRELPRSREIVAYCRGPYCLLAAQALEMLRRRGYRARRFEDGVLEWRARGLPVEAGSEEPHRGRGTHASQAGRTPPGRGRASGRTKGAASARHTAARRTPRSPSRTRI